MASSTSTVAWLSVMVKPSQTVVKEQTILKCSWDDSFGIPSPQVWMWWSGGRNNPRGFCFEQWQIYWSAPQSSYWCSGQSLWPVGKLTFLFFFFCMPSGSQYKFDLSEKHNIKFEWPYLEWPNKMTTHFVSKVFSTTAGKIQFTIIFLKRNFKCF